MPYLQTEASLQHEVEQARRAGVVAACLAAERASGLPAGLLVAIASRETHCRDVVGDSGHGRGAFQIDDRSHAAWLREQDALGPGAVPPLGEAAAYTAGILRANLAYGRTKGLEGEGLLHFAVAAYDAGAGGAWRGVSASGDPDAGTAHANYGADVLERMRLIRGWIGGEGTPLLRCGSRGRAVVALKRELAAWWAEERPGEPPPFTTSDAYGPGTVGAVKAFQRASGLEPDGVTGPLTRRALG